MRTPARWAALAVAALVAGCAPEKPAGELDAGPTDGDAAVDASTTDAGPGAFLVQYADPAHGPFRGGTTTTIRGMGFRASDQVWIGGRAVLQQDFIDSRRFEVVTPPGEPGSAAIEIRRTGGGAMRADAFTFDAIAVDPPGGSVAGGTFVTLTGWGTDFTGVTDVRFDGVPLTGITVQSAVRLTGYAPPGIAGDADVVVRTPAADYNVERGYTYFTTGDPFSGGMSGGPMNGVLNVVVLDQWTKDGIPGAFVAVGDPSTTTHRGTTDALGQITFSGPDLVGPQTVTAWAAEHEVGSFHCFDSANLTIWLRSPIPPPQIGPPPVGTDGATIEGHVMFGDSVGLGSPYWNLVPEPRTPTERKRIYVTTASSNLNSQPAPPIAAIDYEYDPDRLSWPFQVSARAGALAIVAVAGLYDPARDPTGRGYLGFEPFALGVGRSVLVGPGEERTGVDIVVNVPLDGAMRVALDRPPALHTPGWRGPTEYILRGGVDLGGEGLVHFGRHGLLPEPGGYYPGETPFPDGSTTLTLTDLPALTRQLADGAYAMMVGAYTDTGGSPYSVRIVRGIHDASTPVTVGDFLPVPRAGNPGPGGVANGRSIHLISEPPANAVPTFRLHMLSGPTGEPLWRAITCGDLTDVDLPDLSSIGVTYPPSLTWVTWVTYAISTPTNYNQFTYRWLGSNYWTAYASDAWNVQFP